MTNNNIKTINNKYNNFFPGMPLITIKIDNYKIVAVIDTRSQKSTVSLEVATKCNLLSSIDRRNNDQIPGNTSANTIYGTIYDQKIILNNAKITGSSNMIRK